MSEFLFERLLKEIDIDTMDGKARLANKAKPLLKMLQDSVFSDLMYQRLAQLVGIDADKLKDKQTIAEIEQPKQQRSAASRNDRQIKQNATRDAIALILQYPELAVEVELPETFANAPLQGFPLLAELQRTAMASPQITSSALLERWRNKKDFEILQKLMQRRIYGTKEKDGRVKVYSDAIKSLISKYNDARFEQLENKLKQGKLDNAELEEYKSLLAR